MIKGFTTEILRVDLSTGQIEKEKLNEEWARLFLGGRGYGSKIIYEEVNAKIDPLAPENKLVIATGPLANSSAPASGRTMTITKSPLTSTIACANAGGYFGPQLKKTGYDMVIIEGRAEKPVFLWINEGDVEIRDAESLWGKKPSEIEEAIRRETNPKVRIMTIGPAGVKLSRVAGVMFDVHRAAARGGTGAVLGSKNLLGIAVRGTKKVELFDSEQAKKVAHEQRRLLKENPTTGFSMASYGTANSVYITNELGAYPVSNAQDACHPEANALSGSKITEKILVKKGACAVCPVACGRITEIREGKYTGYKGEGPEYETAWSLGAMCGVFDLYAVTRAHYLCNEYGLDAMSAGVTIACAMELYEEGYIPMADVPFPINFGDGDTVVKLVQMMGEREGVIGHWLAEGSYRLAKHYGHPELSMSVKRQEISGYDPRAMKGIGLNYATSNAGAHHNRATTQGPEAFSWPAAIDRLAYEGKAMLTKTSQDFNAFFDALGVCQFLFYGMPNMSDYSPLLRAVTGIAYSDEELMKVGERIWNLERLFNLLAGFTKKDDTLPSRLLKEPIASGKSRGEVCELDRMLPEYYRLRGWNEEGIPTKKKMEELALKRSSPNNRGDYCVND